MPEESQNIHSRGRVLEDLFFFKQDQALVEKKRQIKKIERNLKTLSGISGITDEGILRKLTELDIQVEVLATLSVIPLVEVAWADGRFDEDELMAILGGAEEHKFFEGQHNRSLFEHWLRNQPPSGMVDSWVFYMQGLCQLLTEKERRALKTDLLQRIRRVWETGGGKPGKKAKVSRRKEAVFHKLEKAFEP